MISRLFGRIGKKNILAKARAAENAGELTRAISLYAEADEPTEAARLMIVRGDSDIDPERRLQHYTQAIAAAGEGTPVARDATKKRALLVAALSEATPMTSLIRHDLLAAARDLESAGEYREAARAFERAGDTESQARNLSQTGDLEELEWVLANRGQAERAEREQKNAHAEVESLIACGRRRDALSLCLSHQGSSTLERRANELKSRRASGPLIALNCDGVVRTFVLGDRVLLGRTEGAILVSSSAVSRQHLAIERVRGDSGDSDSIVVRDLNTRNGTWMRGLRLAGDLPVKDVLELRLGDQVPLTIRESQLVGGAIDVDVGGALYTLPLGPFRFPQTGWSLRRGEDDWIEVDAGSDSLFLEDSARTRILASSTVHLLIGDTIAKSRDGKATFQVVEPVRGVREM